MNGLFNELFRPLEKGMCRLSPKGIAVKTSSGFTAYNRRTGSLVNCDGMVFDLGENMFFAIPTNKVRVGDIIIDHGKPAYVKEVKPNALTVLNYETNRLETLVPCRHLFMEQVYFYQKIVSLFGDGSFLTRKKGISRMMQMMMFSQLLKGQTESGSTAASPMSSLLPLMLLGGSGGGNLFDGFADAFDLEEEETDDEEEPEEEKKTED